MRISRLASVLAATTLVAFVSSTAHAAVSTYSATDITLAGNTNTTDPSLLASGVLAATDDFTITGSITVTPNTTSAFDFLFLVGDGSGNTFLGGRIEDLGTTYLATANAGFSFGNAELNQTAHSNQAASFPLTIDFVITGGDGQPTTSSVSNFNGSDNPAATITSTSAGINAFNPSTGFTISLVNDATTEFTVDSINITVIPEPLAVTMLAGLGLACLARRRSA